MNREKLIMNAMRDYKKEMSVEDIVKKHKLDLIFSNPENAVFSWAIKLGLKKQNKRKLDWDAMKKQLSNGKN